MVYPITAGDVLEAIREGAREGTAQAMADMFETGSAKVQLTGQIKDIAANRPEANSVAVGTVYWSVDTGDVSVSTGTTWRSLGVA